jgi:molybdate/tungstate transport system ATP-binding protein
MIEISNLSANIGGFKLKDISLSLDDREYFVILGPTGAGKTILMECIAGIHGVKNGQIQIDNIDVSRSAPEERNIGYVPQDYVLFPFLNVCENIIFGLKRKGYSKPDMEKRLQSLSDLLGITHLLNRDTRSLSGGEKQRVALARALAPSPRILLMDEPLSALDFQTSKHLRMELRRIHNELGITTIHITHNQLEAEELADRIAIMISGCLEQVDKPDNIFFTPLNETVSNFIGSINILNCNSIRQLAPGLVEADCEGLRIILPHNGTEIDKIAVSPRDIYMSNVVPPGPSLNRYKGIVTAINTKSALARVSIKTGDLTLKAELPRELAYEMNLTEGKEVYYILKFKRLKVLGHTHLEIPSSYDWYYEDI